MVYSVIYSKRKTVAIGVKDGCVVVRAPHGTKSERIKYYLDKHSRWISKQIERSKSVVEKTSNLSERDISNLKKSAKQYFSVKTREIADNMGLKYGRITITSAKHRYGSCSSSGNICFSYRLMLYPEAAREYVIVHELAHLLEMNHSPAFYSIVKRYMPDYKERKKLLD